MIFLKKLSALPGYLKLLVKTGVVLIIMLIPLVLLEIFLIKDGRYSHLLSTELYGSNTIWTRYPSTKAFSKHPDTKQKIEIIYNEYSARGDIIPSHDIDNDSIGFFGDSFTENTRIENKFSFVSLLSELSPESTFLNFGVDGYGTSQSFQRWLNIKDTINLDVVVYIFCSNDLRNTYEAKIFDRTLFAKGELRNIVPTEVPFFIKIANHFNITYLVIEAYFKAKSILSVAYKPQITTFNSKLSDKFSIGMKDYKQKFHDEYADSILEEYLSDNPSRETLETAEHLKSVVMKWKEMVEMDEGEFVIAVLPRETEVAASQKLFSNQEIIQLKSTVKIEQLDSFPWHFKKDHHWNEYGNLAGAISFREYFTNQDLLNLAPISNKWIENKKNEILEYYKD